MVEETKIVDTNTKTQLSLAAALFFSPLVQNMLNKNTRNISEQDKDFIRGYIKFGYITLLFWLITITTGMLDYLFALQILNVTYTISIFILTLLLIMSIVSILSDISLVKWRDYKIQTYTVEGNKKDIILKYLPIYNIYLWYISHSFDKPNRRIKESILLWMIFLILGMLGNVFISSIILIFIIFRVASLMSDIDFLNISSKQRLNTLFLKNPEEIVGYITWVLRYLSKLLINIFTKTQVYTLASEIKKEKDIYSRIIDVHNNTNIIIEYILWIFLVIWYISITHFDFTIRTYYASFWLLLLRYLVMVIHLKHLPHLPIAREILFFTHTSIQYFKQKFFIHK